MGRLTDARQLVSKAQRSGLDVTGDLAVSNDDATWVLTSYLVSNGIVLTISVLLVLLNLAIDLLYAVLDPRVRHA